LFRPAEDLPPVPTRPNLLPSSNTTEPEADSSVNKLGEAEEGGGGEGKGLTLSGDALKAFLAQAQAHPEALRGPPPQEDEPGSQQPKNVTVDDPEFAKYWKAPIAGGRCCRAWLTVAAGGLLRRPCLLEPSCKLASPLCFPGSFAHDALFDLM
jgi:hypothetical protein